MANADKMRDAALLDGLDEETARLLFPERFSREIVVTFVYPAPTAKESAGFAEMTRHARTEQVRDPERPGRPLVERASFDLAAVESMHALYSFLEENAEPDEVEIRVGNRSLPLVRELWLPLLWLLRS